MNTQIIKSLSANPKPLSRTSGRGSSSRKSRTSIARAPTDRMPLPGEIVGSSMRNRHPYAEVNPVNPPILVFTENPAYEPTDLVRGPHPVNPVFTENPAYEPLPQYLEKFYKIKEKIGNGSADKKNINEFLINHGRNLTNKQLKILIDYINAKA